MEQTAPKIYAVEDNDNIREMLVYALAASGFAALGLADGQALYREMERARPDLILLDIMLPGDDGLAILKKLKAAPQTAAIPVIMLTARSAEYERIKGLDLGADDYISKPFAVMEVIARVRAVLRRAGPAQDFKAEIKSGSVSLNSGQRSVRAQGEEVSLTYKEFELLHYLMRNQGFVLSRDKIMAQVWEYDHSCESRTVDMHIKSLRQKLGASGKIIKTIRNVGYKIES